MAHRQAKQLSEKTREVYDEVVRDEGGESVLEALQRAEEISSKDSSIEEIRSAIDIEKSHLSDVIGAKAKLQETVGSLIAGYDALTNALGGEIDSMKAMTFREKFVGFFSRARSPFT